MTLFIWFMTVTSKLSCVLTHQIERAQYWLCSVDILTGSESAIAYNINWSTASVCWPFSGGWAWGSWRCQEMSLVNRKPLNLEAFGSSCQNQVSEPIRLSYVLSPSDWDRERRNLGPLCLRVKREWSEVFSFKLEVGKHILLHVSPAPLDCAFLISEFFIIHTCILLSFTLIIWSFRHELSGYSHTHSVVFYTRILRLFTHAFSGHSHAFYTNILKPFTHTFSDYSHTHSQVIHTHSQIIHTCILMSLNVPDLSLGTLFLSLSGIPLHCILLSQN